MRALVQTSEGYFSSISNRRKQTGVKKGKRVKCDLIMRMETEEA